MKKITIIGNGSMAFSLANGLKDKYKLEIIGRDIEKINDFEKRLGVNINKNILDNFNIENKTIILCVKPNNLEEVSKKINGKAHIFISVLAGIKREELSKFYKYKWGVRIMPNISASIKKSMTIFNCNEKIKKEVELIIKEFGNSLYLDNEDKMDISTAISGSGPAFLAFIAQSLIKSGKLHGLTEDESKIIVNGLFESFSSILQTQDSSKIISSVMSPNGTTEEGMKILKEESVDKSFSKAIYRTYKKSKDIVNS